MPRAVTTEIKPYTLCFAGVKLPEPFQSDFAKTSQEADKLFPGMKLMYPRVDGHITASYLGDMDDVDLQQVSRVYAEHSHQLVGQNLRLEGIQVMSRRFGFRAMVDVLAPDAWHRFVEAVNQDLAGLTAEHLTYFARFPHVTIGNNRYERGGVHKVSAELNQKVFAERARRMQGEFPLTELTVWGMDMADVSRTQIVRRTIPIGGRSRRLFYGSVVSEIQSA